MKKIRPENSLFTSPDELPDTKGFSVPENDSVAIILGLKVVEFNKDTSFSKEIVFKFSFFIFWRTSVSIS